MGRGDTLLNAAIGAAVTVVLSFTGLSPLLGGGVAGYLQQESRGAGAKAGALSGAFAAIPIVVFVAVAMFLLGFGVSRVSLLLLPLLLIPLVVAWNVGLGAAGGYVGTYVRQEA